MKKYSQLIIVALALVGLPFFMNFIGLGVTSATEVVIFALACMALNILVGFTGLVSFGHGAWFGLAAYAAGLIQKELLPGHFFLPILAAVALVAVISTLFGALILRRKGVYFSLLTLALCAMLYAVAFRWTAVTGGEDGLGGIKRPQFASINFDTAQPYYMLVAILAFAIVYLLWRFHRSPIGTVLVAIRENEQRAKFIGYATDKYKLVAFVVSATIAGFAGTLLLFNNRMTSAEPISVAFSGELLAMVVIGGMRSFLGPALGAMFFVIFRDYLSGIQSYPWISENWLLWFGLLFVGFILFSPTGLVGVGERVLRPFKKTIVSDAAMSSRKAGEVTLPDFLKSPPLGEGFVLKASGMSKSFGGIKAVQSVDISMKDRQLHALIGPNGAGKTTAFNLISGLYTPDAGSIILNGKELAGLSPEAITQAGIGRSFQITNLFPTLTIEENVRLAVQARSNFAFSGMKDALTIDTIHYETSEIIKTMGLGGLENEEAASLSYGGQRLLDMSLAVATKPRVLLLDEPLAGLAAAERQRVGNLIKAISTDMPVLLVEHDINRVFEIADHVTVMNEGQVLTDGSVENARSSKRVQEVYIGSGSHALAEKPRATAAKADVLLSLKNIDTYYGKSHILRDVNLDLHQNEILALLGRNGAGKSTLLKTIVGIAPPAKGEMMLAGESLARKESAYITRRGVSYVPQGRGLFAGMSVKENMELGSLKRITGAGSHWEEDKIFSFFPRIKERWSSPADYLSGGEQQMVAVARALSGDTRVLLLDEPFEGLAPAIVEELFEAFDKLRHEVSIIIVDHHLDLALALSDRAVVLERGAVSHTGESAILSKDIELRKKVLWL